MPAGPAALARRSAIKIAARRHHPRVANIVFSVSMGIASLVVAVLAATKGVVVVAVIWGALAGGFAARAELGRRRRG